MSEHQQCRFMMTKGRRCKNKVKSGEYCRHHTSVDCPVCFETIQSDDKMVLTCGHTFHTECMVQWYASSSKCPVCRKDQGINQYVKLREIVEDNMREKYRDAINSLEEEILRLRRRLARPRRIDF